MNHPKLHLYLADPIWTVSQKCEVRDDSKDPRLYQFPNAWYYFCASSLFLRQNKIMQDNWGELPFAPGFSPELHADKFMARFDRETGPPLRMIPFDWEKFDKGIISEHLMIIKTARQTWDYIVNKDITRVEAMEIYYHHITNRVCLLPNGWLYYVTDGNPSGHNNTTSDNNLEQIIRMYMCFKEYHCDNPNNLLTRDFFQFLDEIGFISFGDDGLAAAYTPEHLLFFEQFDKIARRVTGRGLTIDEDVTIENFIYLGRKFFKIKGHWFSYGADTNRASYGLIHKLERKNFLDSNIQDQRIFGQWQLFKNLHLHPQKQNVQQYSYLVKLEEVLNYRRDNHCLDNDISNAFDNELALVKNFEVATHF